MITVCRLILKILIRPEAGILFACVFAISTLSACSAKPTPEPAGPASTSPTPKVPIPSSTIFEPNLILSTLTPSPIPKPSVTPTPLIPKMKGNLWYQILRLEDDMPGAGSEDFVVPSDGDKLAFSGIVSELMDGDVLRSAEMAAMNHFKLFRYTDRKDENAASYLLRELKPIQKGWGLYIFRIGTKSNVIIEAPHPIADEYTTQVAMQLYRELDAQALLIAGAHRDANRDGSADITHTSQSIFQAVHETLIAPGSAVVLQIHGFSGRKHPGYPQVVLGHNLARLGENQSLPTQAQAGSVKEVLNHLEEVLKAKGIWVGICDQDAWQDLCGEKNTQSMVMDGGVFIHMELNESIRADSLELLVSAVTEALSR